MVIERFQERVMIVSIKQYKTMKKSEELALKILQEETDGFESQNRLRDDIIDAMIRFSNEREQLTIPTVVGQSEKVGFCMHNLDMTGKCSKCGEQYIRKEG